MEKIMSAALELLENRESFVMSMVINQSGSTPRDTGAKMIIRENEEIIGTIGGGLVEAEVQRLAKKAFEDKKSLTKKFVLNREDVAQMDMICGGNVTVYLKYVDAKIRHFSDIYKEACNAIEKHSKGWLITLLSKESSDEACNQWFLKQDGTIKGDFLKHEDIKEIQRFSSQIKEVYIYVNNSNEEYMVEPMGNISRAYIYGAGHVGHKLAQLLSYVGFYTVVLDDREKFANKDRFSTADEIVVLDSFDGIFTNISIDKDCYIIIVTRGHQHDQTVLAQALRTNAGYIGMIGSRKKRNQIYENLTKEGFDVKEFERVYSPIGLEIEAETPEEIGVSITAELIKIRAKKTKKEH